MTIESMDKSSKSDIPWELIAESFTGNITVEGDLHLQQWISSGPENKAKYLQIEELWKTGMDDYLFYRMANEEKSWKALAEKIENGNRDQKGRGIIPGRFFGRQKYIRNLIAIAAVFIGFAGIGLWFFLPRNRPVTYETAYNVQKKVRLIDGSVITLQPNTKIEIPYGYNKSGRSIIMDSGEASFEVVHNPGKSFVVELGSTQIKDIGTSFTIRKESKSIDVSVSSGKIAFVKLSTRETRELNAGSAVTFDMQNENFGEIRAADSLYTAEPLMVFENTPLSEVIVSIRKIYGKKIIISDDIAHKKFTGQLEGMSYNNILSVICESLGLEYAINDSVCIIKERTFEQP